MFEQIEDYSFSKGRTWKEWLVEAMVILAIVVTTLGIVFYALQA